MRSLSQSICPYSSAAAFVLLAALFYLPTDVDANFHNAPASAKAMKNPYAGNEAAAHRRRQATVVRDAIASPATERLGKGTGNVPSLVDGKLDSDRARRSLLVRHPGR
jgi:hypothetical protein